MKKLIIIIIGIVALAAMVINSTKVQADTYTNAILSLRLPVSDQQLEKLRIIRRNVGDTNLTVSLANFMTNYIKVEINDAGKQVLTEMKVELLQKVAVCEDDTTLLRIQNALAVTNAP